MGKSYFRPVEGPDYRLTLYACCAGYVTQALANCFAPLLFLSFNRELGIPISKITFLITLNFFIQLLTDFLSMKFADRLGYRASACLANIFALTGFICLAVLPYALPDAYTGILVSAVFYAVGGGLMEVLLSPITEACPFKNKERVMASLHSFYCWGCVLVIFGSALFFKLFPFFGWRVLSCLWAAVPLLNLGMFLKVPMPPGLDGGDIGFSGTVLNKGGLCLLFIFMFCSGAAEQSMSQWASAFAEAGLGLSKTGGDMAGPGMFAICMGLSRLIYGRTGAGEKLCFYMEAGCILCIAGYLLAAFSKNPVPALFGCALCGFSVGILWPGVFSLAPKICPAGGTAMYALLALGGDLGCGGGPTLAGAVLSLTGSFGSSMLAAAIFPAIMLVGLAVHVRRGVPGR